MGGSKQTWVVEVGPARPATAGLPSAGPVYRNIAAKDGFPTIEPTTLFELFENSVKKHADKECLGRREVKDGVAGPFVFKTYKEVGAEVAKIASGLMALGVKPKQRVTVLGGNCTEWMMAMQVVQGAGAGAEPVCTHSDTAHPITLPGLQPSELPLRPPV